MAAIARYSEKPRERAAMPFRLHCALSLLLSLSSLFAVEAPYCIVSFEKMNPHYMGLAIGDHVNIKHRDGTLHSAIFAGSMYRWARPHEYFFIEKGSGVVFSIDGGYLHPPQNSNPQTLPTVLCQSGGTCAVHSTFKGLLFLSSLGEIRDPRLKRVLKQAPERVLNWLLETPINAEIHEIISDLLPPAAIASFPDQATFRIALLNEMGVDAKKEGRPSMIRRHLESGFPVIIDLPVVSGFEHSVQYLADGAFANVSVSRTRPGNKREPEKNIGRHSVLAVGFISYGPFKGKLLVLDSNDGNVHFWDYADLEKVGDLKGALLGPTDRVSEQDLRANIRDYYRDHFDGRAVVSTAGVLGALGAGLYLWSLNSADGEEKKKKKEKEKEKEKSE